MPLVLQSGAETGIGPVVPAAFDVTWWVLTASLALVAAAALVHVVRSRGLSAPARVVWILLVLLTVPVGAIAALVLVPSRRAADEVPSA